MSLAALDAWVVRVAVAPNGGAVAEDLHVEFMSQGKQAERVARQLAGLPTAPRPAHLQCSTS